MWWLGAYRIVPTHPCAMDGAERVPRARVFAVEGDRDCVAPPMPAAQSPITITRKLYLIILSLTLAAARSCSRLRHTSFGAKVRVEYATTPVSGMCT